LEQGASYVYLLHDTIQVQRMPVCQYLGYGTAVTSEYSANI